LHKSRLAFDLRHDILADGIAELLLRDSASSRGLHLATVERTENAGNQGSQLGHRTGAASQAPEPGEDVGMTQPAKFQEPSMEEILASIRRIIADDDANKPAARPPEPAKAESQPEPPPPPLFSNPPPAPPPTRFRSEADARPAEPSGVLGGVAMVDQSSDILDLTESMAAPAPEPPAANPPPGVMRQPAPQFRTIEGNSDIGFDEPSERPAPPVAQGPLISGTTSAAIDSAFNALAQTVLVQNARTLEDLVREMLRPMLKSWLDDNLPGMVERLVRAEIERVSRGRAG
jgi:cell pole-organizing protein PopZ